MVKLSAILRSTEKNFRHWFTSPRVYIVWLMMLVYTWTAFGDYAVIAERLGEPVSLCAFPFLKGEGAILYGSAAMLLYGEAPFTDRHAAFLVIRTGRRNWMIGQLIYIFLSSLIYVLGSYLTSILVMIPHVQLEFDWGKLMWTLAQSPDLAVGTKTTTYLPDISLMNAISGGKAVLYTILMLWLIVAFLGIVSLCFNILIKKGSGTMVVAVFTGLALFSEVLSVLYYDVSHPIIKLFENVAWISPITWRLISQLLKNSPPMWYAILVLISGIVIMGMIAVFVFCKKDVEFEKNEY